MKKYIFILATAAIFAGCSDNNTFKQFNNNEGNENDGAIGFTSFTEKVTKATAENSESLYTWTFFDHQESFQVWARKAGQADHEIFDGTTVTVSQAQSGYIYTYSPARFWDKTATEYHFYAAAPAEPADGAWGFEDEDIDDDASLGAGYFTTTSTLNGVNLKHVDNLTALAQNTRDALYNVFKEATVSSSSTTKDIDKLIAAPCQVTNTYFNKANPDAVNLNFIHILSKLNVTISTKLYDATNNYDVDLLGFELHNIPNVGSFSEATKAIPADKKVIRWTLTTPATNTTNILTGIDNNSKVDVTSPTAAEVADNKAGAKQYIVESLIIPQNIEYERVALDGKAHAAKKIDAVYYSDWEDYTQSMPIEALTKEKFDELYVITEDNSTNPHTFTYVRVKTLAEYQALEGKENTSESDFKELLKKIEKIQAVDIPAYSVPSKPYFVISYSIDGDIFTQYFNLAAAFNNLSNNEILSGTGALNDAQKKFAFSEGWQNTLNIVINPEQIEFTADVAEWSSEQNYTYEIEQGNENPDTAAPSNP